MPHRRIVSYETTIPRIVGKVTGRKYEESVRELCAGELELEGAVSALLAVRARIEQEIRTLEENILGFAKHSEPCRRLVTVPGIGVLTAVSFVTAVDDPARFVCSSRVGAYFGLTRRRYQLGEVDRDGVGVKMR
ncbi:transposase [Mesorhizobium sp. M2A.F.Ca.ET.039.01.1.1]|uniref:transposase n=1 Tax=Mesorhizobium sp. M2A.F.Ca.ET.039.01.1.1 TaxID=2496746 RepID=UPI000FCBD51E|nr:transposase [Mesorhizobium sp. M2A.F.Ca.ET.039.01.1.1]RWX59035.1 hypothetical protein EOA24_37265 [Mesorhizobium sp. M2A.F.Ca.ET.039.01.1.1]